LKKYLSRKKMATSSLSASTIPSLNTRNSTSNYSSKLSSFSSLQFPAQLHRLQFRNRGVSSHSRQRNLPLVTLFSILFCWNWWDLKVYWGLVLNDCCFYLFMLVGICGC
jgi:hypothetical protein